MDPLNVDFLKQFVVNNLGTQAAGLSEESFAKYFVEYKKYAIEESGLISALVNKFLAHSPDATVLDIGAGIGDIQFSNDISIASYIAYECNPILFKLAEESLSQSFKWKATVKKECFSAATGLARAFNLVLISHSLYGIPDEDRASLIKNALNALEINGTMLIFHRSSSIHKIENGLREAAVLFERVQVSSHIDLPPREQFGKVISVLVGKDLETELGKKIVEYVYEQAVSRGKVEVATSCLVVRNHRIQDLHRELEADGCALLLSITPEYDTFLHGLNNKEAREIKPIGIVKPQTTNHVQICAKWANANEVPVSVVGGGHSEHCSNSEALVVSMESMRDIEVNTENNTITFGSGATAGDITREAWKHKLVVPLGDRPSVGCGLILQGGVGHYTRMFGLATDNVTRASVVLMNEQGQVLEADNSTPESQALLWMIKGAGSNVGIVTSITMHAHPINSVDVYEFVASNTLEENNIMDKFAHIVRTLPNNSPLDLTLTADNLYFCGYSTSTPTSMQTENNEIPSPIETGMDSLRNLSNGKVVSHHSLSPFEIYDLEPFMQFPKGTSFKRCVFINSKALSAITPILMQKLKSSPSKASYFHFVGCGGEAQSLSSESSAFGLRNWDMAIVVTGLWQGDLGRQVRDWVYDVVDSLEPSSVGIYGVDLGPIELHDTYLARRAFGSNMQRICELKAKFDPKNILRCGCPIIEAKRLVMDENLKFLPASPFPARPNWLIIVCGKRFVGKDYFALRMKILLEKTMKIEVASISEETKRMFAEANEVDFERLCNDRGYKERYRQELTSFYKLQKEKDKHFDCNQLLSLVARYPMTGMREAEVLQNISSTRCAVVSIYISASKDTRFARGLSPSTHDDDITETALDTLHDWHLTFENNDEGNSKCDSFINERVLPKLSMPEYSSDSEMISSMVVSTPNFPKKGIIFRDLLALSNATDQATIKRWMQSVVKSSISSANLVSVSVESLVIVSVESGGFMFGAMLAESMGLSSVVIRKAGKLAPPVLVCSYMGSHVAVASKERKNETHSLTLSVGAILPGQQVILVDDVLATGDTILACMDLLYQAKAKLVKVICLEEFLGHKGKARLTKYGIDTECLVPFWGM